MRGHIEPFGESVWFNLGDVHAKGCVVINMDHGREMCM